MIIAKFTYEQYATINQQLQDVLTRGSLSTAYKCKQLTKTLAQPLCSPINLILAVGQGGTAVVRGDVLKLHLHQHIHLEEINGAVGVPVGLLQGHLAVLGAHVGQLRLDERYLLQV